MYMSNKSIHGHATLLNMAQRMADFEETWIEM